jgi:hypothetical protein
MSDFYEIGHFNLDKSLVVPTPADFPAWQLGGDWRFVPLDG